MSAGTRESGERQYRLPAVDWDYAAGCGVSLKKKDDCAGDVFGAGPPERCISSLLAHALRRKDRTGSDGVHSNCVREKRGVLLRVGKKPALGPSLPL